MKLIKQGAEAKLFLDGNKIIKERNFKEYRIRELDNKLRSFRTRREAKIIQKAAINVPKIYSVDEKKGIIEMEFIDGKLIRDIAEKINKKERINLLKDIGKSIRILHNNGIIHGDLTTSNMILKNKDVYFIDFGLGFFSEKIEDKAVDIYLLQQVLNSMHYSIS
nr:Kae1-associated serine/threonine protein kinase [Candidatus Woesearchaeota archaeon]